MHNVHQELELSENLVADGFESFVVSQYFPNNFNILVGKDSQYVYHFDYVQLRRKGRMTDYQKKKAMKLKKTWPLKQNSEIISFLEIEQKIAQMAMRTDRLDRLTVFTDEKREYRQCLSWIKTIHRYDGSSIAVGHKRISSRKRRDLRNELFAVNYLDREIRKDMAEHHRESTCFARNVNSSVSRMMVYIFHHNFFKSYRLNGVAEKKSNHADAAGIGRVIYDRMLSHIFTRRFFISQHEIRGNNEMTWCKANSTPLKRKTDYLPRYTLTG